MDEELSLVAESLQVELPVPISLPCSVIMPNHSVQRRNVILCGLESTVCEEGHFSLHSEETRGNTATLSVPDSQVTVSVHDMPLEELSKFDHPLPQRNRKAKRPYSPELIILRDKKSRQKNVTEATKEMLQKDTIDIGFGLTKPFSCEKCKSPFVVNPARSRIPLSKAKRKPVARKIVDEVTKKVLVVCNACGLATGRKPARSAPIPPTDEEKANYLKESIAFAKSLAETLHEPDAEQLYCPIFKMKPCQCLQSYIIGNGLGEEHKRRALHLLSLSNEAKVLRKQKDVADSEKVTTKEENNLGAVNSKPSTRGLKLRRSHAFEQFVLSKRRYLRDEFGLCERACQRILMYSNNFLHKKVKSAPNNGPRVERLIGKNARGVLKPIPDLSRCNCCANNCVLLSLTHSKLLESWRHMSSLGQRQARRALAEMLTPTGGTKANCFRFIAMVTGCSYTTISLVNEHMKQTQGDREPPEHGLKRWWRNQSKGGADKDAASAPGNDDEEEDDPEVYIPSQDELRSMGNEQAASFLQKQRDKLVELQKQLTDQQALFDQQRTMLKEAVSTDVLADTQVALTSQQLLDILQLPATTTSSVLPTLITEITSSPTISVMTCLGDFEPLGNISNISATLPANDCQATFSNVVIIPDPEQ